MNDLYLNLQEWLKFKDDIVHDELRRHILFVLNSFLFLSWCVNQSDIRPEDKVENIDTLEFKLNFYSDSVTMVVIHGIKKNFVGILQPET